MNEIVKAEAEARKLPSVVLVLSSDGREWAKEWGAKEFFHGKEIGLNVRTVFNINEITFGPYERGWSIPHYFCLLDTNGQQINEWIDIGGMEWWRGRTLAVGDTLNFFPGSLQITLTFDRHFARPNNSGRAHREGLGLLRRQIDS